MSRKHYLVVLILFIGGVFASYLLLPQKQEIAQMEVRDKYFQQAKASYEDELAKGNLTVNVVSQLATLYLQAGEIEQAIALMERFVAAHPDNVEARQKLGSYYQYAQRSDDYLRNLEEINRLQPKPENMKQLSDIYNSSMQHEKQEEVLKQLIADDQGKDPKYYIELAQLQAAKQNYAAAIGTLQAFKATHPGAFTSHENELLVTLLYDERRAEQGYQAAEEWIATRPDPAQAARLIGIVHVKDEPQRAQALLARFTAEQIEKTPDLLEESILLQLDMGQEEEAYAKLKAMQEAQKGLSSNLFSRLLMLASARGDRELVRNVTTNIDLTTLTELQLMTLTEFAVVQQYDELLELLTGKFSTEEYAVNYPLLAAALAVGNRADDAKAKLDRLQEATLTTRQSLQMARICAYSDANACVERFMAALPPQEKLSDSEIALASDVYLAANQWDKGYAYINEALKARGDSSPLLQLALVKFDAAKGNTANVAAWMEAHADMLNSPVLYDLYFTAMNRGQADIGILAAREMEKRYPGTVSRTLLANAYFKAGWYAQAAELLRPAEGQTLTPEDENNYIMSLSKVARRDNAYRRELGKYALLRLRENPPKQQKLALLYALIDSKQTDIAMPYIRELALSQGGQWAALYAETLDKQGKHDEARAFWMTVANQPSTPSARKLSIAYDLLARGYKADAESIFLKMAGRAAPDSKPVQALLYVWGPRLEGDKLEWLVKRYETSTGKERDLWAALIAERAPSESLVALVNDYPALMNHRTVAESYLQARAAAGILVGQQDTFLADAQEEGRADILRAYAKTAGDYGLQGEARKANEALVRLDPNDMGAWRDAGIAAYGQADYASSKFYLTRYLAMDDMKRAGDPLAYRAYFYYGELLRREGKQEDARRYYQLANALVSEGKRPSAEMMSLQAQSQLRMGDTQAGWQTYRLALDTYPEDATLRGDFIFSLIEMGRTDEARQALQSSHALLAPAAGSGSIPISGDVKHYILLNNAHEALITFVHPLEKGVSPSAKDVAALPWVSYSSEGYDTLLVAAKPGYQLDVDTQGPAPIIIAKGDVFAQNLNEQTALRYELLNARLELETGEVHAATERLDRLVEKHPDDSQLLGFAANAENYGGNWPQAQALLARAQALAPLNEDILELDRSMRRLNAPNVKLDHEWISRGDNDEQVTTLSGFANLSDHLQLGAMFANNYARGENVRLADGRVGNFSKHRQQAEIYLRHHQGVGVQAQLSVFANNDTPGVGGYFSFLNPLGETLLTAEFHRPYWEYTQAVLDDATRDRLAVKHTVRPETRLSISVEPNINRYHVEDKSNVRTTAGVDAQVVYRLIDEQPYLALGYGFDGEYELSHKKGFDSLGGYTPLFPLASREIHFLSLAGGWEFSPVTYADGLLGYGVDRLGGSGPAVEGRLTHEFTDSLDGQIRAYWGLDTSNSDNTLTRLGGYLRWRY